MKIKKTLFPFRDRTIKKLPFGFQIKFVAVKVDKAGNDERNGRTLFFESNQACSITFHCWNRGAQLSSHGVLK